MTPVDSQRPLTDEELVEVREFLAAQKRLEWLGRWARNVALWIAALITSWIAFGESLKKLLGIGQ